LVHIFDRTNDAVTYLDGLKVDTTQISVCADWDLNVPGQEWAVGQVGGGNYAVGGDFQIDDLGFWRRTLTEYEAQGIYIVGSQFGRSFDTTASPEVKLVVTVSGNHLTIGWSKGTLESTDDLRGQWQTVSGANPPSYTTAIGTGNRYYRAKLN
jgi:hypothetical protein